MQALKLDFCRSARAPRWLAPLLLVVAAGFAGDVGFSIVHKSMEIRESEAVLASLDRKALKPVKRPGAEEVAAARETMQRLATPWDKLFGALESASSEQVALLAIEPDPKTGTVLISGDSKDYLAALTYVLNLSQADALSRVHLARHETRSDATRTVGFSVSAAWGKP